MARSVSDEELQLKKRARRRLVGAVVLVTAVAVVLPMILDSAPKPANQSIDIQIPSPDAGVLSNKPAPLKSAEKPAAVEPLKAEAVAEAKTAGKTEAVAEVAPAAKVESKAEPQPEVKAESKPQPAPVAAKPASKAEAKTKTENTAKAKDGQKAKAPGAYAIQVAALSDVAKAKELQAKIAGGGLKAYTEVVQTAGGPVTRVRVGPYPSREAAEKARASLQRLQLDGKVVPR